MMECQKASLLINSLKNWLINSLKKIFLWRIMNHPTNPNKKWVFSFTKKRQVEVFLGPTWLPGYPADQTAPNLGTPSRRRKRRPVPLTAHPAPHGVKRWSRHVGWPPLRLESGEDGCDGEKGERFRGAFSLAFWGGWCRGEVLAVGYILARNPRNEDFRQFRELFIFFYMMKMWRKQTSWHPSFQVNLTLHWTSTFTTRDLSWGRFLSVGKISILIGFFFNLKPPPSISTLVFFKKKLPDISVWKPRKVIGTIVSKLVDLQPIYRTKPTYLYRGYNLLYPFTKYQQDIPVHHHFLFVSF